MGPHLKKSLMETSGGARNRPIVGPESGDPFILQIWQ